MGASTSSEKGSSAGGSWGSWWYSVRGSGGSGDGSGAGADGGKVKCPKPTGKANPRPGD